MFSKSTNTQEPVKADRHPPDADDSADGSGDAGRGDAAADETAPSRSSSKMPARISQALMDRLPESGLELTAENLPVLNAFNEFLEVERRASRRRFRGLFWLFLMLLVASLTAAVMVGWGVVRHMQAELASEREVADMERQRIAGELSMVAGGVTDELNSQLAVRDRAVRYTYRTLADHIDGQTNRMVHLLETMSLLEQEIHELEHALRDLSRRTPPPSPPALVAGDANVDPELESRIEQDFAALRRLARQRQEALASESEGNHPPVSPPPQETDGADSLFPLTIRTPEGGAVPWRL